MRIELGAPILQFITPGGLGGDLYHLPAVGIAEMFAPATWPTICGLEGLVFAYSGPMRRRRACAVCRRDAPAPLLTLEGLYLDRAHGQRRELEPLARAA